MKKFKLFIENFLVYGFGGIINKIIPLIMVPITTRLMPSTEYYGINDMCWTIVSFGSALAIMGMYDAMFRMFFDKDELSFKRTVCSTALVFTCITSAIIFFLMLIFKNAIAQFFFNNRQYAYVVYLSAMATLVGATNGIISAPTRMQNKRKVFLIANTLSPLLAYSIAIPMLLAGHYVLALPLATLTARISLEIAFGIMNRDWFKPALFDIEVLKQLLAIAIPLFPNFVIYWVFNSSDKIMITNLIGIGATGLYAVGAKLGNASHLIYTAFAGGWQYFAFSTMKEDSQVESNSRIFEYLGVVSFVVTAFICAWSFQIFRILFKIDYLGGYIVAPYLFLAPLLQMLFQVAANQFLVVKKTWPNMIILSAGAVVNLGLNYLLIPVLGIEGASIATLMGYLISDIVCVFVLCRMKLMIMTTRFLVAASLMGGYIILWRLAFSSSFIFGTLAACLLCLTMALLYIKDIKMLVNQLAR